MRTLIKISMTLAAAVLFFGQVVHAQVATRSMVIDDDDRGDLHDRGDLDKLEQQARVSINLEKILQLFGPREAGVTFVFDEIEEFKKGIRAEDPTMNGLYKSAGVTNGIQEFSVAATVNWKLDWHAELGGGSILGSNAGGARKQTLALNNIGAKIATIGKINRPTDEGAIALRSQDFTIIKRAGNQSNIGDQDINQFKVAWRVGTMERPSKSATPSMNSASLLEQKIGSETFKFDVVFTLSQDDPWVR
ncbi:MAG: hypothetical protein IPK21_17465 [Haliscomenobacter sp.]|nr:hypothetical protein [Haliscomenobacter sp.]